MGAQSDDWIRTARVLRRAGFGVSGAEVDALVHTDLNAYLAEALAADPADDPGVRATPVPQFVPPPTPGRTATPALRKAHNAELGTQLTALTGWWLRRMAVVQRPVREKLTFVWHNHFATSAQKVRDARAMAGQNESLRRLGTGDFGTLAYSMLTDPAMLRWLDGASSTAKAPNENLAREFMELFALGHGNGYTESDVREGARALTGWTVDAAGHAAFVAKRHDAGAKTVLGASGPLDARAFCDAVLARSESAGFVVGSLWRYYAADAPASADTLARLTGAYGSGRALAPVVRAVLADPAVAGGSAPMVVGPVDWLVGAIRALRVPLSDDASVTAQASALRALGQLPFYPPNVGGWPRGQAWLSTAAAQKRLTVAADLVRRGDIAVVTGAGRTDRVDAVGHLVGVGNWSDRTARVLTDLTGDPARLVAVALNTPEYLAS